MTHLMPYPVINMQPTELSIIRLTRSATLPTYGVLLHEGIPKLLTLELPDRLNQVNDSCIPAGRYECSLVENRVTHSGMIIPKTLEVRNVPNRSGILFHTGNTMKDSHGCILLGMEYDIRPKFEGIVLSRIAMDHFEDMIYSKDMWEIDIRWAIQ